MPRRSNADIIMQQSLGRVQTRHRWHRRAFCLLLGNADPGVLCAVIFLVQTQSVREKCDHALDSGGCDRATHTPHSTPQAHVVD